MGYWLESLRLPIDEKSAEIAYYRQRGLWDVVEVDEEPVQLWELVSAVVREYRLPADRCWQMTVRDLCLMIRQPEERQRATDTTSQYLMCVESDRRRELREKLSVEERIELEDFKLALMR